MHKKKQLFLSIYVDDFKMAGKKENLAPMWTELRKTLNLEPPVPMSGNTYLGCQQQNFTPTEAEIATKQGLFNRVFSNKQGNTYSSSRPADQSGEETCCLNKTTKNPQNQRPEATLKAEARAPALSQRDSPGARGAHSDSIPIQGYYYQMSGHCEQTVEKYLEFANKPASVLKQAGTPCLDDSQIPPEDF